MTQPLKTFLNLLLTPAALIAEGAIHFIEETAHDSMLHLDKSGRITKANRQSSKALGYTRKELLGKPFRELFEDANQFDRMLEEMVGHRKTIGTSVSLRNRDGSLARSLINAVWLQNQNHVMMILHSISEDNRRELDARRET